MVGKTDAIREIRVTTVFVVLIVGFGVMLTDVESLRKLDRDLSLVLDSVWPGGLCGTSIELSPLLATG